MTHPHADLRSGLTTPVVLLISRRQVEEGNIKSVLQQLKILTAAREDTWLYRGQMSLVIDGYDADPRELVDIPEVRKFLTEFATAWPYWVFFFNQIDDSLVILGSCVCGKAFPGAGAVEIDMQRLEEFMHIGFAGLNELFLKHRFPQHEFKSQSSGFVELFEQAFLGLN